MGFLVATFGPHVLQHLLTKTLVILFSSTIIGRTSILFGPKSTFFLHPAKFLTRKNDRIRGYVSNQFDLGTLIYLVHPTDLFITACLH